MGQQPPPERISFSQLYISIDLAILLLSALQIWLLVKVFCWRKRVEHLKRQPGVLPAHALLLVAWEIVVPLMLVIGLPLLLNTPWPVMLLYQPDIISWLVGMMLLSTGTAITRTLLAILACRKRQDHRRPVLQAIRLVEGVAMRRNDESRKEAPAVGLSVRSWSPEARGSLFPLRSGSLRSIAAPQPPQNGTCEFPHMLAQAELPPLTERGFETVNPWLWTLLWQSGWSSTRFSASSFPPRLRHTMWWLCHPVS